MATYQLSHDAFEARLKRARRRLRLKYGFFTLVVAGLGLLNYERNEQRHWQTELVALVLCGILLVAGYLNGHRLILAEEQSPLNFYRLTVGRDCVECRDRQHGDTVLHVSEIVRIQPVARGLCLRTAKKSRSILVPANLQDYAGCVAELKSIGVPV